MASGVTITGARGQGSKVLFLTEKKSGINRKEKVMNKILKKKRAKKREESGTKLKHQEGSFTLPLVVDC